MDIEYIERRPVLHIVYEAIHFSSAQILSNVSIEIVQDAFVICWSSIFTDVPNTRMIDHRSQLRETFVDIAEMNDVHIQRARI